MGDQITFSDEPILPPLNNLASHASKCKKPESPDPAPDAGDPPKDFNLKRSAELMAAYLREGKLNPEIVPTQKGFLRLFAAWILDESLPWTTGQAPMLALLFKYLKVRMELPTDTTVRNHVAHIFAELHGQVVHAFNVHNPLLSYLSYINK